MNHCVDCNCEIGGHGQQRCEACQKQHLKEIKREWDRRNVLTGLGGKKTHKSRPQQLPNKCFKLHNEANKYPPVDPPKWVDPTLVTLAEWLRPLPVVRKKIYSLRAIYCKWRNGYGKS